MNKIFLNLRQECEISKELKDEMSDVLTSFHDEPLLAHFRSYGSNDMLFLRNQFSAVEICSHFFCDFPWFLFEYSIFY